MKTRNVFAASVVLIGSTLAFSAIAASNYDSSGSSNDRSGHDSRSNNRY